MTAQESSTSTYVDRVLETFETFGDRDALIYHEQRLSYAQARTMVFQLAGALRHSGLRTGEAVTLFTGNLAEAVLAQLAVHLIGCRLVFVPPDVSMSERVAFVKRAETVAFVFDPAIEAGADTATQVQPRLVFSLGPAKVGDDLLALAARMPEVRPEPCVTADEVSTLFYTGGSTGRPKMVLHHHAYYEFLIPAADARKAEIARPHRFLICTPVSHTSGHVCSLMALLAEGSVVLLDRFDAAEVIATMRREDVTSIFLVPPMLYELLDHPDLPPAGFPSLVRIHYSGAPTNPIRIQQAIHRFGPVMRQIYGMTEVSTMTVLEPDQHDESVPERLSSCGQPLAPWVEVSVRDEAGEPVGTGRVGEVCARGPLVMAEYWKDPEMTAKTVRDGWMYSGDLGRFDDEGFLHLVDRVNGVIITGRSTVGIYAANVYSHLLEDVLTRQPGVRSAAAVGLPDDKYGESVHVICVADADVAIDVAELKKRVVQELGPLYEPLSVVMVDSMPLTPVGKIDKKALRRMLVSRSESPSVSANSEFS